MKTLRPASQRLKGRFSARKASTSLDTIFISRSFRTSLVGLVSWRCFSLFSRPELPLHLLEHAQFGNNSRHNFEGSPYLDADLPKSDH